MSTKKRFIEYHIIKKKLRGEDEYLPFLEIKELIDYILSQEDAHKMHELKSHKSCCLKNVERSEDEEGNLIICGLFKSVVSSYRPPLMNRRDGSERENPKTMEEGDGEKTHFCIKIIHDEEEPQNNVVYIAIEKNGNGICFNQMMDCFKKFETNRLRSLHLKKTYSLVYDTLIREDYEEVLESLCSAKDMEVYFDKSLLGNAALDFSNRIEEVQESVKLTIKATRHRSIKNTAKDILRKFVGGDVSISKLRI